MASILVLKRRIQAALNVSKTTRAMQMIAASKMKKAQDAALSTRPYVERLLSLSQSLTNVDTKDSVHPYLKQQSLVDKTLFIVISPDKGLCGGLITNLVREFLRLKDTEKNSVFLTIGKKIETQIVSRKNEIIASFIFGNTTPTLDIVYSIVRIIDEHYISQKVGKVVMLSTHFSSIFSQKPTFSTILPISIPKETTLEENQSQYVFEPSITDILSPLLKHYLEMIVFQHLLESFVSEQASRMIAMQGATDNANGIIEDLRLEYNKTRQAKITSEILDIGLGNTQSI